MKHLRLLGATLRLTRLIVTDDIGQWWIKDPIDAAMARYQNRHQQWTHLPEALGDRTRSETRELFDEPWWWRYRDGLDCPHCIGFWAGLLILTGEHIADHSPTPIRWTWKLITTALALNAVTAHGGDLAGYYPGDD